MLVELITKVTENYHDLGHNGEAVDHMIDSVSGMGHRLKYGHDLEGMINSYGLDGVQGVGEWFDHMSKDFTSPDGLPLPFADAIHNITGMKMDDTIDLLCINAADAIEVGTQAALMKFFKENPKAYKATIVIGTAMGIVDDNPLLLAFNTIIVLSNLKQKGKLPTLLNNTPVFLNRCGNVIAKASMITAAGDFGLGFLDIDMADSISDILDIGDHFEVGENAFDIASTITDIVDGIATLGLSIAASKGVKKLAAALNENQRDEFNQKQTVVAPIRALRGMLNGNAPPQMLIGPIELMIEDGLYKPEL